MFVLAYRNANGSLRVSPRAYATAAQAGGFAKYYSRKSAEFHNSGLTFTIIDLTGVIAAYDTAVAVADDFADEDYLANHQHVMADTPDGRQCRICYYS